MNKPWKSSLFWVFSISLVTAYIVGQFATPQWAIKKITLDVKTDQQGQLYYTYKEKPKILSSDEVVAIEDTAITVEKLTEQGRKAKVKQQYVVATEESGEKVYYQLEAHMHWGLWSLLPAFVAIILCWVTREPLSSLFGGIVAGAFLLGRFDLTESVLVPYMATEDVAGIVLLYLCLLGALMGIWARTGAGQAFAEMMTKKLVRGPKSAKLVAWMLGVVFFQGGTVSTVLVGTTVKPIADKENISHEELSYIVDSTASPIACLLPFNAWPGYVQAFLFVSGVSFLATEADRLAFFFASIPLSFYAIFAVLGTFLLAIDKGPFLGKQMHEAIKRSRETGQLDAPGSNPLSAKELQTSNVPEGYTPHVIDFFLPLVTLITIAIATFIVFKSPKVRWAFGAAVLVAILLSLLRGMKMTDVIIGMGEGFKSVVLGTVILLLAMVIGGISKETGGGLYLVELLGDKIPFWALPVLLQLLTMIISFSTGTSWGTYAVSFPLAMPLAWEIATIQQLTHPQFFMMICFATVLNGSVFGDQCSPISDTTILSAMCTGCDLMDHVKTQIVQASYAAGLAAICWTACVFAAA